MRAYPAASSEQSGGYKLRLEYIGRSRENLASKRMMNLFNNCHVFTRGLGRWRGESNQSGDSGGGMIEDGDEMEEMKL